MGTEENNSFRLNRIETDIKETKDETKEISREQNNQKEKLIIMAGDLKSNLETNKIIKNTALAFLVINVLGIIWALFVKI